jgi:hypothetical protein
VLGSNAVSVVFGELHRDDQGAYSTRLFTMWLILSLLAKMRMVSLLLLLENQLFPPA